MRAPGAGPTAATNGIRLQAAHICSAKPGERESGDAVFVRQSEDNRAVLAVIDGLGHGSEAALASRAAVELLGSLPVEATILDAMQGVHTALRGTRGAAATICVIDGLRMESCAVGNVQLLAFNCTVPLVLSAGILGHRVARFRVTASALRPGSRLALLSDGISTKVRLEEVRHLAPAEACELVIGKHRREHDDATVLIADVQW